MYLIFEGEDGTVNNLVINDENMMTDFPICRALYFSYFGKSFHPKYGEYVKTILSTNNMASKMSI